MVGADDLATVEVSASVPERGAAVRAEVVERLDRGFVHPDQQDRLVADPVGRVIALFRDLVDSCGDLPDAAPQLLELEPGELRVGVAADADALRQRLPERGPIVACCRGTCGICRNRGGRSGAHGIFLL